MEGAAPVTVVSYGTWQREFGGAPDVLGRRLTACPPEQTRELGIRRALGASERSLRRSVSSDALRTTLVGGLLGLAAALTMSRLLAPLLFQVSPADPVTALGVSVVIVAVSLLAAHVPVRRAMRIDPRVALEAE